MGIQELISVDSRIRDAILRKVPAEEMRRVAIENGMITMFEDGLAKAAAGITSLPQILRMLHE